MALPLCPHTRWPAPQAGSRPARARLLTPVLSSSSDYGFERSSSSSDADKCFANFWFNPQSPPDDCVLGQTYTSSLG